MVRARCCARISSSVTSVSCAPVQNRAPVASACDVGCGFGRLTPVLTEFAERVVGFEREEGLLTIAQSLQPAIDFRPIESLQRLPADQASFNLALVFTVLQHVPEPDVRAVIDELRRIVRPDGYLLLCEETDATLEAGDREHAHLGYTCGRLVTTYEAWLAPWKLLATRRRTIEPDYPRPDVGTLHVVCRPRLALTVSPTPVGKPDDLISPTLTPNTRRS